MANLPVFDVKPSVPVKPMLNVGCLMDIPTGNLLTGIHGESIINGGYSTFEGIVGGGNLGKSTIGHYRNIMACYRAGSRSTISIYDTEMNIHEASIYRLVNLYTYGNADGEDWQETRRLVITDSGVYSGDEWYDALKGFMEEKIKSSDYKITSPFRDRTSTKSKAKALELDVPNIIMIDSLSNFITKDVTKMQDDNSLGDKGANMMAMQQNRQRSRVINECPGPCAKAGIYMSTTAHIGEKIQIDPYAPNFKPLPSLKSNLKIKGVPPNYTFFTLVCWWLMGSVILKNSDKTLLYPADANDKVVGDSDLNVVSLHTLRNKNGPSSFTVNVILSQRDGVQGPLSEFHFLKINNYYGLVGSKQSFACALLPDVKLSRTTVRQKLNEDALLRRAINICSEMLQMKQMWRGKYDPDLDCTPEELYEDIKKLGYDWNFILTHTRGWWTFEGEHTDTLFLSTMDLLKMRKGLYHPYWLEDDKVTIKKQYAKDLKL